MHKAKTCPVKMAVNASQSFSCKLRRSKGAYGQKKKVILLPRKVRIGSINTGRKGKYKLPNTLFFGELKKV